MGYMNRTGEAQIKILITAQSDSVKLLQLPTEEMGKVMYRTPSSVQP